MIVWIMRSSTPLKKEISAVAVLITQLGPDCCGGLCTDVVSWSELSVTGTIVNLFVGIRNILTLVVQTKAMVCATIFL